MSRRSSRNDLIATALRHERAARERAEIDAAFSTMGDDPGHQDEVRRLDAEFARAGWEALQRYGRLFY